MHPDQLHQPAGGALSAFGGSGKSLWLPGTVCFSLHKTYLTVIFLSHAASRSADYNNSSINNWQVWVLSEIILPQIALREDIPSFLESHPSLLSLENKYPDFVPSFVRY